MYIRLMIHDFLVWGFSVGAAYPSDEVIAVKSIPTITTFLFPQTSFIHPFLLSSRPPCLLPVIAHRVSMIHIFSSHARNLAQKGNEERTW